MHTLLQLFFVTENQFNYKRLIYKILLMLICNVAHLFIFLLLFGTSITQICFVYDPSDQLQSGSFTFVRSIYFLSNTFQIPTKSTDGERSQVAVSASSIGGYNPAHGFYFRISEDQQTKSRILILKVFTHEESSWESIKVTYLVSNKKQIVLGSFLTDSFYIINAGKDESTYFLQHHVPVSQLPLHGNYRAISFISGLNITLPFFSLSIINETLNNERIVIRFSTNANSQLEFLQLSYVIYPTDLSDFIFGGPTGTYELSGTWSFQHQNITYHNLTICKLVVPRFSCSENETASEDKGDKCVCRQGFIRNASDACVRSLTCSEKEFYDSQTNSCICKSEFIRLGSICTEKCPFNQLWVGTKCICIKGAFRVPSLNQCKFCPNDSIPNNIQDTCICSDPRQIFSLKELTCETCPEHFQPNPDRTKCVCLQGYYYSQKNDNCIQCLQYCRECLSLFRCQSCLSGFQLINVKLRNSIVDYCETICGDGIKTQLDNCDDGNIEDGDGCNHNCFVQDGWKCSGGDLTTKSTCNKIRSIIMLKGGNFLDFKAQQSIEISYLPPCITNNQCADCSQILKVIVTSAQVPIKVNVKYVPKSQYKFLVQFDLNGLFLNSAFIFTVQIRDNLPEKYKGCFTEEDLLQKVTKEFYQPTVDPGRPRSSLPLLTYDNLFG